MNRLKYLTFFVLALCSVAHADNTLERWLAHQAEITTWQAQVIQIRRIKNLTNELSNPGTLQFIKPNQFRWELGKPLRTLAIRDGAQLLIAYPRLQQAERYPFDKITDPAMKQALLLLEVGFPSDATLFYEQYAPLKTTLINRENNKKVAIIELEPKAGGARKLLEKVILEITQEALLLEANELHFSDGSSLRNEFTQQVFNSTLPESVLNVDLTGYEISEPLSQK
ncbi:outer membrane lipoprotein-sorting protein [Alteromonadaceae bacterium 2753L.S.0a.02]|nr:outer membrane lipoprotein-sorting protein [Alteromonadaceae bacterium 2753L.S.0a.02]